MVRMADLRVPPGPGVPQGLLVPGSELAERFARSGGPGGQGVNTTDSRVQLSLDLGSTGALTEQQRERVRARLQARLVGTVLTVDASEHRSQRRNRQAARERMADLLRGALAPPPPKRRPTRPTRGSKRRRRAAKEHRSRLKEQRRRPSGD